VSRAGRAVEAPRQRPQLVEELGRLVDVDVGAEQDDTEGEPFEVVVRCPVLAAVRVDRRQRSAEEGKPSLEVGGGGVHGDAGLEAAERAREALLDVGGGVLGRQRAGGEPRPGRRRPVDAIDAERAPVLAPAVPGDQVPVTDARAAVRSPTAMAIASSSSSSSGGIAVPARSR
jgi:hypothetical protein